VTPRDERGRFVAKPVLHRQVQVEPASKFSAEVWTVTINEPDPATAEWLQLTEPREVPDRGARWAWALLVMGLALVIVAMLALNGWVPA
jgi:hypothetical protein